MSKNFIQTGKTIPYTAGANIASGDAVLVGDILAVAPIAIANGDSAELDVEGVFEIAKLSTDTFIPGQILFWDDGNKRLTEIASTHKPVGISWGTYGNGTTKAYIKLTPMVKDTTA